MDKYGLNKMRPAVYTIFGSVLVLGIAFLVLFLYAKTQANKQPKKVYKSIPLKQTTDSTKVEIVVQPPTLVDDSADVNLNHEGTPKSTNDAKDLSENDLVSDIDSDSATDYSTTSPVFTHELEDKHGEDKQGNQETADRIAKKKAEVEVLLEEGKAIREQAMKTVARAMPILVNHLKTLPPEKQLEYLEQVKAQLDTASPPELQEVQKHFPDINLEEEGWTEFLKLLQEHGYTPPKEIE